MRLNDEIKTNHRFPERSAPGTELFADHHAGIPDILVSGLMPIGVVHMLQPVQIKDDHAEFPDFIIGS